MGYLTYDLHLVTPAFLGNACQQSEWRVPPVKALLRQWWRIVAAKGHDYKWQDVREIEGAIFGHAWLAYGEKERKKEKWSLRSPVVITLEHWKPGSLHSWGKDLPVSHPEVGHQVGSQLYLGYGPLTYKGGTTLKVKSALNAGEQAYLHIRFPDRLYGGEGVVVKVEAHLKKALELVHGFGAIGGRSRNGWGSVSCLPTKGVCSSPGKNSSPPPSLSLPELDQLLRRAAGSFSREWHECLQLDWPHAIGADQRGILVWRSKQPWKSWEQAMQEIAILKISLRTQLARFERNSDVDNPVVDRRHIFGYPVTNHGVLEWSERNSRGEPKLDKKGRLRQTDRLANQLRFKVHQVNGGYVVVAFHLPHRVPEPLVRKLSDSQQEWLRKEEQDLWSEVHAQLDKTLKRV